MNDQVCFPLAIIQTHDIESTTKLLNWCHKNNIVIEQAFQTIGPQKTDILDPSGQRGMVGVVIYYGSTSGLESFKDIFGKEYDIKSLSFVPEFVKKNLEHEHTLKTSTNKEPSYGRTSNREKTFP